MAKEKVVKKPPTKKVVKEPSENKAAAKPIRTKKPKDAATGLATVDPKITDYLMGVPRAERFHAFLRLEDISDQDYWHYLRFMYQDQEFLHDYNVVLRRLLSVKRPMRELMMNDKERDALAKLPDDLIVHRGHVGSNAYGISWTLDLKKAEWFADRFPPRIHHGKAAVTSGVVRKRDVVAYLLARKESEIVVDPKYIKKKTTVVLSKSKWKSKK